MQGKISFRRGKKGLSAKISDSKQDLDFFFFYEEDPIGEFQVG